MQVMSLKKVYFSDITINAVSKLCLGLTSFPAFLLRKEECGITDGMGQ